jgi:short-subunit dehydrogenase
VTELRNATALVTGAYGGIGRAIAIALRDAGCQVVVTGRDQARLEEVAQAVGARAVVADLARPADMDSLITATGDVDIVVANAAVPASGDLEDWTQEQIDRAIEVNLTSPIALTRALLPGMRSRGRGHFVYISSLSGKVGARGTSLYSATKFGLRGFASGLRCDLHGSGVGASVVFPGFVSDAGMFAETGAKLPFGVSTVTPEKVAAGVVKVISRNRPELDVAPLGLKAGAWFGSLFPNLTAPIQARAGTKLSEEITGAQKDKR